MRPAIRRKKTAATVTGPGEVDSRLLESRPLMPSVADCLRQHGETFLQQYSDKISLQQRKVLSAITRCRTGELGSVIFACDGCGRQHWVGRSCGNRHCPSCQHEKTQKWLQKQTDRLLPVQHCLVTFTVPDELRSLLRACPQEGYDAIFAAGSATIQKLLARSEMAGLTERRFLRSAAHVGTRSGDLSPACPLRRAVWWCE